MESILTQQQLSVVHAYWRAANYLSVGQIYLVDNPLLQQPLQAVHIKPRLMGHWGTTPGLNFIYAHLNRIIGHYRQAMICITGPGHGAPAFIANRWIENSLRETYPALNHSLEGMRRLFKQFSFPGGISSHIASDIPGSMHEGGELGYALSHAFGAAFDNPDQIVVAIIGDGEAETGPLAASWHSNKFLHPVNDGPVLPILHLNGYKINNPTVLASLPREELNPLFEGYGYTPYYVVATDDSANSMIIHQQMACLLDQCLNEIQAIRRQAIDQLACMGRVIRPRWPMIILETPKGWTAPKYVDGKPLEGHWRSHQVPFSAMTAEHIALLEAWLKSYHPDELFTPAGAPIPELVAWAPQGGLRLGVNPHVHGHCTQDLILPNVQDYAIMVNHPGRLSAEATRTVGTFVRDVMVLNRNARNFRLFGPDETTSNRLNDVYTETGKTWLADVSPAAAPDSALDQEGRVMEILSEHTCQGWLEGYVLTGRHGLLTCYEAFIHIIDSMFNQHAKWLKTSRQMHWRTPIPSLNYLLTSHVWRQDHNGFSHQDPGFIDHVINKKAEVVRVYLPPDANTLLCVMNHCLASRHYVNVIVAGKQSALQYLSIDDAILHCTKGVGIWEWASTDAGTDPDIVLACAGDVPTMEALAATDLLRQAFPDLRIRFVNVVDLMVLQPEHPHGLDDNAFNALFTVDKPVIFAFHGYPALIHRLTYRRQGHAHWHVHGYHEEGTTTTPFDMAVLNRLDRYHLAIAVIDHLPHLHNKSAHVRQHWQDKLLQHKHYIYRVGDDMPEVKNWYWPYTGLFHQTENSVR